MLIVASNTSFAADKITSKEKQSKATDSSITQTEQKHLMWGLSSAEYARYEELMKGIRGSISPKTISPLEVLGIHAPFESRMLTRLLPVSAEYLELLKDIFPFSCKVHENHRNEHVLIHLDKIRSIESENS